MKKWFVLCMVLIMIFSLGVLPVSADGKGAHIFVDGQPLPSRAISKNNVSFVPFRELFEKLILSVEYNAKQKQVTGTKSGLKISFTIGSKTAYVNGVKKSLQAAPFSQNGSTFIPVRIVGEATGNAVYFAPEVNIIQINSPSFTGASYDIDGTYIALNVDGTVSLAASLESEELRELAEIQAIQNSVDNFPKVRIVGVPPTAEQAKDPGFKGYPDYFDENYVIAAGNKEKLPPLMSEGWISLSMLSEIEGVNNLGSSEPNTIVIGKYAGVEFIRVSIVLTDEYKKAKEGDFVLSGIHVKKYKGLMYLSIDDLQAVGLIGVQ
ncbi:hypothetical protein J2Z22_000810 [Paenibacillus forsythiae]|uniref:Copper amine oxidase-like N-terminal domain-containing protein n=1 Tax=Paenibacillus forsythiae TaxID=365616 RepID=A0ABU3H390_9BACL|nr:copper amine oxidase N-terminal domain-containing protein [Paenibacillus forsythiae]MDT3425294.1 hypothetical protein [Paenibacillus forsythiae]